MAHTINRYTVKIIYSDGTEYVYPLPTIRAVRQKIASLKRFFSGCGVPYNHLPSGIFAGGVKTAVQRYGFCLVQSYAGYDPYGGTWWTKIIIDFSHEQPVGEGVQ